MAYITRKELEDFTGKYPPEDDTMVQVYCDSAMEMVSNYLGYNPELGNYSFKKRGDDGKLFAVKGMPVLEILSAKVNGNEVDAALFCGNDRNYIMYENESRFYSDSVYEFEYKAGYENVPFIIKTTALQIATLFWESAGGNLAVSSTSFADSGNRVFNNFKADRFLEQIASYKAVTR